MSGEIRHEWDGPVLTVYSDSGASSSNLQGPKGDVGPRGPQGAPGVIYDADGQLVLDLSPYATQETVDAAIAAIPKPDMSNYASKNYVSTEIARAQLEGAGVDTSGFATKDDLANVEVEIDHQTIICDQYGNLKTAIGGFANQGGGVYYKLNDIAYTPIGSWNNNTRSTIGNIGKAWVAGCLYNVSITFKDGKTINFDAMFHAEYMGSTYYGLEMDAEYTAQLRAVQNRISDFSVHNSNDLNAHLYGRNDGDFSVGPWFQAEDNNKNYTTCPDKWIVVAVSIEANDYVPIDAHYIPVDGNTVYVNEEGKLSCSIDVGEGGSINLSNYYTKAEVDKLIASINTGGGSGGGGTTYPSGEEVNY